MSEQKTAPVFLQIREDGRIQAVFEDGTPLKSQMDVQVNTDARSRTITATITVNAEGWLPPLDPGQADHWRKICSDLYRAIDALISPDGDFQPVARGMMDLLVFGENVNAALALLRDHKEALGGGKDDD